MSTLLCFAAGVSIFVFTGYGFYRRIGVFGCGDECVNYAAGYFLNQGKTLYREIFFNHQPGLAYVSALIQRVFNPSGLYQLVLYHRLFVMGFSFVAGAILLVRFGLPAFLFLLAYEGTKYYLYGYQFIGEAFVVYPLVMLLYLLWEGLQGKRALRFDGILAAVSAAGVLYVREPYIPAALGIWLLILWQHRRMHQQIARTILLFGAVVLPMAALPFGEFYEQVVIANLPAIRQAAGTSSGVWQMARPFLYPMILFVSGSQTLFGELRLALRSFFGSVLCRY